MRLTACSVTCPDPNLPFDSSQHNLFCSSYYPDFCREYFFLIWKRERCREMNYLEKSMCCQASVSPLELEWYAKNSFENAVEILFPTGRKGSCPVHAQILCPFKFRSIRQVALQTILWFHTSRSWRDLVNSSYGFLLLVMCYTWKNSIL